MQQTQQETFVGAFEEVVPSLDSSAQLSFMTNYILQLGAASSADGKEIALSQYLLCLLCLLSELITPHHRIQVWQLPICKVCRRCYD